MPVPRFLAPEPEHALTLVPGSPSIFAQRPPQAGEPSGPREAPEPKAGATPHDRQRPATPRDPALCVRCKSCASLCPTYAEGREEGMNARGRMVLLDWLDRGALEPSGRLEDHIFSCMLCGACASLCPREMDVTGAIYEARKKLFGHNTRRRFLSYGVRFALKRPSALFRWARTLRGLGVLLPAQPLNLLRALNGLDIGITSSPLREGGTIYRAPRAKGRVAVFAGCTVNYLYPDMGRALIATLNRTGYDVVLPKGEVCCGAPLLALGLEEDAAGMMRKNIAVFQALHVQAVLSLCPTCVSFITGESERLIGSRIENSEEVSRFLLRERCAGDRQSASLKFPAGMKVLYHDPCHTLYHLKVRKEPREIIRSLGYTLVEPKDRGCCGFGGTFRAFYPSLSEEILRQRVEDYSVADMIVTSCPNCVLQFRARMKDKVVKHIIELL